MRTIEVSEVTKLVHVRSARMPATLFLSSSNLQKSS